MTDLIGKTLGQYQILREIGRGGMAVVYEAYQPALNRTVAIKVLPTQYAFDQTFVQRFLHEARAAARLTHANIVAIYDVGVQDGVYFIVMQKIDGEPLHLLIRRTGRLPLARVVYILAQVSNALDYAHASGIVHRDIKPSNIIVGPGDLATLMDFGIAKLAERSALTQTGTLMGTPEYMSPEQAKGADAGKSSDLYALGVTLYEMLAGRVPFRADNPIVVLHQHGYETPPPIRSLAPDLGPEIESIIARALAKSPAKRYPTAGQLAQAMAAAAAKKGKSRTPPPALRPAPPQPVSGAQASGAAGSSAPTRIRRQAEPGQPAILVPVSEQHTSAPAPNPSRSGVAGRRSPVVLLVLVGFVAVLAIVGAIIARRRPEVPVVPDTPLPLLTSTPTVGDSARPGGGIAATEATPTPTPIPIIETASPTMTATPTATNTPTSRPSPTSTPTTNPTAIETPTANPTATETPTAVPTATETPTASPTATAAATPRPTPTASPVRPTATSPIMAAPTLLNPPDGFSASGGDVVNFAWMWNGPPLESNHGFEVRIWKDGQPDHFGAADPVSTTIAAIRLTGAYGVQQGGSGTYFWTVAVVQRQPYQKLGPEPAPRTFTYFGGESATPTPRPP